MCDVFLLLILYLPFTETGWRSWLLVVLSLADEEEDNKCVILVVYIDACLST